MFTLVLIGVGVALFTHGIENLLLKADGEKTIPSKSISSTGRNTKIYYGAACLVLAVLSLSVSQSLPPKYQFAGLTSSFLIVLSYPSGERV